MQFRTMSASGGLSAVDDVASTDQGRMVQAGIDRQGNAVVGYTTGTGTLVARLRPYDAAGPRLSAVVPARATRGKPFVAIASAYDVWSAPVTAPVWRFDGGSPKSGLSVSHVFRTEGAHRVSVTTTDQLGNATTLSRTVVVPDRTRPRLTRVRVTPRKVSFRTNETGRVTVTLTRPGARRVVNKRLTRTGAWNVWLPNLARGRWKAVVVVRDPAGNRANAVRRFNVD
jgi:hypothetical protein